MPSADEIRDALRATWAGLSAGWEKWEAVIMDQLHPVSAAMIERLDISDDHQHLDIAAGTGEPGLTIARLAPDGRVVLTDLAPEMLAVAARRARAQGIANVETQVCSADDLPFAEATFDGVSVRFGYMFFPDGAARLQHACELGRRTPRQVSALYEAAGLRDVVEWDVEVDLVTESAAQYWEVMSEHVSLAVAALQQVDEPARARIRATALANVSAYEKDGEVRVPGMARCIVGTK